MFFHFLHTGVYTNLIKLIESKNYPGYVISMQRNSTSLIEGYDFVVKVSMPGNSDELEGVSFQSIDGAWLSHSITEIKTVPYEKTQSFKISTTFFKRQNKWYQGYFSFESSVHPGYFLRHTGLSLKMGIYENNTQFKEDASWKLRRRGKQYCVVFNVMHFNPVYFGLFLNLQPWRYQSN